MIIFLDFDGVVATQRSYHKFEPEFSYGLDRQCVQSLNTLIKATHGSVVISSSWRLIHSLKSLRALLQRYGLEGDVIDITPRHSDNIRGLEIQQWISEHNYTGNYVVIDDEIYDITGVIPNEKILHIPNGWHDGGLQDCHISNLLKDRS